MRRAHWLGKNSRSQSYTHAIFVDTETKPVTIGDDVVRADLWFGWACYVKRIKGDRWTEPKWIRFEDAGPFWDWVEKHTFPKNRTVLIAHNVGFDLPVLDGFHEMNSRGWKLGMAILDDPPTMIKWTEGKRTLLCLDSMNWFRMSLASIGNYIGVDKLEMPSDDSSVEDWDTYCKRDVKVLAAAVLHYWKFIRSNDLGNVQPTISGQAFSTFRHKFLQPETILIDDDDKALKLARSAYYGGRTESFQIGPIDEVFYLDFNSMYPAVMMAYDSPTKLINNSIHWSIKDIDGERDSIAMIGDVDLEVAENDFPYRTPERLLFPLGEFRTVLAGPELLHALDTDSIRKVHSVTAYVQRPIFSDYVDYFYKMRLEARAEGNESKGFLAKQLLNSLYGRFGMSGRRYENISTTDDVDPKSWEIYDMDIKAWRNFRSVSGLVQEQVRDGESRDSAPAIPAYIASHGRMTLLKAMYQAGKENVFYCDTDSLVVNREGYDRLSSMIDPDRLGALKVEYHSVPMTIRGVKDYVLGDIERIKGVRNNAIQTGPNTYKQDRFRGLRGAMRDGDLRSVEISTVTKTLTREYLKGIVDPVTGRVAPFVLPL